MAYGASNGADMSLSNGVDAKHGMSVWHWDMWEEDDYT